MTEAISKISRWFITAIQLFFVNVLTLIALVLVLEIVFQVLIGYGFLKFKTIRNPPRHMEEFIYDPATGWRMRPNALNFMIYPHGIIREENNADGWRDRLYPKIPSHPKFRIGAMGDSFTYGYGVKVEDSYPKVLERLFAQRGYPFVEVLNFGVNGWGIDQTLLGYTTQVRIYKPNLLLVFLSSDTVLRTAYKEMWLTPKPYFILKDGALNLENFPAPVQRFSSFNRWLIQNSIFYALIIDRWVSITEGLKYHRFERDQSIVDDQKLLQLNVQILKRFKEETDRDGVHLIVMVYDKTASVLIELCRSAGVEVVDLQQMSPDVDLRSTWREGSPLHFPPPTMHWNIKGNQYIADALFKYLAPLIKPHDQ